MSDQQSGEAGKNANKPAADTLTADIVAGFKRVGDMADVVGRAAVAVREAADAMAVPMPRRWGTSAWAASAWAASAWADLLRRFTGR